MQDRLNFAVFIDYDNIATGVWNTLKQGFDYKLVKSWLEERGEIQSQIAYGNWNIHPDFKTVSRGMAQLGVKMEHLETSYDGSKNGADIALSIDALELVFTQEHIDAFCILSGDSDFLPLVQKLKRYNKRVYVVAGIPFTSENLRRNCHQFVSYEDLAGYPADRHPRPAARQPVTQAEGFRRYDRHSDPLEKALPAMRQAIREMERVGEIPYIRQLEEVLLEINPGFDARRFECGSFKDLIIRLVDAGHLRRKMIGEGRFCIAEPEGRADSPPGPRDSHRYGQRWPPHRGGVRDEGSGYSRGRDRGERSYSRGGPPDEAGAPPMRQERPTAPSRPVAQPDPKKALSVIRQAVRQIALDGKNAELDLLYRTVLDLDPRFRSYGCAAHEFRKFAGRLAQDGELHLEAVGGTFVVELHEADDDPEAAASRLSPAARHVVGEILRESGSLLTAGIPSKQMEAMFRAHPGFDEEALGVAGAEDLLARVVREGFLELRRDAEGRELYFPPESAEEVPGERVAEPAVAPGRPDQSSREGRGEDAESPPRRPAPVSQAPERKPRGPAASAGPQGIDAALEVLLRALRGNPRFAGPGLSRSELRAAIREADSDFEVSQYGVRSLRDLLDHARAKGYLGVRDTAETGIRYVGTTREPSAPEQEDSPGDKQAAASDGDSETGPEQSSPDPERPKSKDEEGVDGDPPRLKNFLGGLFGREQ